MTDAPTRSLATKVGYAFRNEGGSYAVTIPGCHGPEPWLSAWLKSKARTIKGRGQTREVPSQEEAIALLDWAESHRPAPVTRKAVAL